MPFTVVGKETRTHYMDFEYVFTPTILPDSYYMITAEAMHGIKAYNLSDPTNPTILSENRSNPDTPRAVVVANDRKTAWMVGSGDHGSHLTTFNITNVSAITMTGWERISFGLTHTLVKAPEDDRYVFTHTLGQLNVYNVSDTSTWGTRVAEIGRVWRCPYGELPVQRMVYRQGFIFGGNVEAVNVTDPLNLSRAPLGVNLPWGGSFALSEDGSMLAWMHGGGKGGGNLTIFNVTGFEKGLPLRKISAVTNPITACRQPGKMVFAFNVLYAMCFQGLIALNLTHLLSHNELDVLASSKASQEPDFHRGFDDMVVDPKTKYLYATIKGLGVHTLTFKGQQEALKSA